MPRGKKPPEKHVIVITIVALLSIFCMAALYLILAKLEQPNQLLALLIFSIYVIAVVVYTRLAFQYKNIKHL